MRFFGHKAINIWLNKWFDDIKLSSRISEELSANYVSSWRFLTMKVSYRWLREYLHFDKPPEELSQLLTNTGLEVEHLSFIGKHAQLLEGVVTGKVLECEGHPNADKLKVTLVDIGLEALTIVCGAPNVEVGQHVLVAKVGSTIYPTDGDPITLKKAKIRGIESNGMICAEDELGLGNNHDGILILPEDTPVGIPASLALSKESDCILEIGLTPNRCDAMGHFGVARDIRAYLAHHENQALTLNLPDVTDRGTWDTPIHFKFQESSACTAYYAALIKGVKVTKNPSTYSEKLQSIGIASINNVVDCTNFVMHELGTPLHAFDARFFQHELSVRFAYTDEKLITLDGVNRALSTDDLVISGDGKAHCLAGVFGGKESGVGFETVDILLESAVFDPSTLRKTSKRHGIHSDASFRFERGVDPELTRFALQRAIDLILETAGGTCAGIVEAHSQPENPTVISLNADYVNRVLGSHLSPDAIERILLSLDFQPAGHDSWTIPRYRADVQRPIDVVEEIVRIAGFNCIPDQQKWSFSVPVAPVVEPHRVKHQWALMLASRGFSEILNNSLTKARYGELPTEPHSGATIHLKNPLSRDLSMLRNSMLYGMLETMVYNRNRQAGNLSLFEFGNTYHAFGNRSVEKSMLCLAMTGILHPESWIGSRAASFFDLKGHVLALLNTFGPMEVQETPLDPNGIYSEGLQLSMQGKKIGTLGKLAPEILQLFDLKQPVFYGQLELKPLLEVVGKQAIVFQELPKTFQVRRDFALVLDQTISYSALEHEIRKVASTRLKNLALFDVYEGDKIASDKKSYAVAFHYQDPIKTLTDIEIDAEMETLRKHLEASLGATLR